MLWLRILLILHVYCVCHASHVHGQPEGDSGFCPSSQVFTLATKLNMQEVSE
jgi:hypothetical protein